MRMEDECRIRCEERGWCREDKEDEERRKRRKQETEEAE